MPDANQTYCGTETDWTMDDQQMMITARVNARRERSKHDSSY
jgi:hypothetical protein